MYQNKSKNIIDTIKRINIAPIQTYFDTEMVLIRLKLIFLKF
jgi:hypothetical protein